MPFLLLDDAADQAKQRLEQFGQGLFQPLQPIGQSVQDITQGLQNFGQQQLQNLSQANQPPLQGRSVEDITSGLQDFGQVQLRNVQQTVRQVNQAQAQPPFAQPEPSVQPGGDLEDYARQAARKAGIDPDVFVRQMQQESGLQPTNPDGTPKTSPAGAVGVAQFMPETARGLGLDPTDPYASLDAAAKLDAQNLQRYGGDWSRALAAYNAGPGAVDRYGDVPPFSETQSYVSNILGGAKGAIQQGAQNVAQATGQTLGGVLPAISQFGDKQLTAAEAYAACGPAAAVRFAMLMGRQPTLREATDLAAQVGWTPQGGMAGLSSESALFDKMQIPHRMVGADWSALAREASSGNPVTISTPGHYFTADAYDPSSGAFHVGSSGTDLRGGSEWMTPQQMEARMGALQGGMAVDNPQVPGPSPLASGAATVQRGLDTVGQAKDRALQILGSPDLPQQLPTTRLANAVTDAVGGALDQAGRNLSANLGLRPRTAEEQAAVDAMNARAQGGYEPVGVESLILGGGGPSPIGPSTPGDVIDAARQQWITEHNPLRDTGVGGFTSGVAGLVTDPLNLIGLGADLRPGMALADLLRDPSIARLVTDEAGNINYGRLADLLGQGVRQLRGGVERPFNYDADTPEGRFEAVAAASRAAAADGLAHVDLNTLPKDILPFGAQTVGTRQMGTNVGKLPTLDDLRLLRDVSLNQRDFYGDSANEAAGIVGPNNIDEWQALNSITSSQTPLANQVAEAIRTMGTVRQAAIDAAANGQDVRQAVLDAINSKEQLPLMSYTHPQKRGFMAQGYDTGISEVKGAPKTSSFQGNYDSALRGVFDPRITNDTWDWQIMNLDDTLTPGVGPAKIAELQAAAQEKASKILADATAKHQADLAAAQALEDPKAQAKAVTAADRAMQVATNKAGRVSPGIPMVRKAFNLAANDDTAYRGVEAVFNELGAELGIDGYQAQSAMWSGIRHLFSDPQLEAMWKAGQFSQAIQEGLQRGVFQRDLGGEISSVMDHPTVQAELQKWGDLIKEPPPLNGQGMQRAYYGLSPTKPAARPARPATAAFRLEQGAQREAGAPLVQGITQDTLDQLGVTPDNRLPFLSTGHRVVEVLPGQFAVHLPSGNSDTAQYVAARLGQVSGAPETHIHVPDASMPGTIGLRGVADADQIQSLSAALSDANIPNVVGASGRSIQIPYPQVDDVAHQNGILDVASKSGFDLSNLAPYQGILHAVPESSYSGLAEALGPQFGPTTPGRSDLLRRLLGGGTGPGAEPAVPSGADLGAQAQQALRDFLSGAGSEAGAISPQLGLRLGGAALGGLGGATTAPEGASPQERLERAGVGAAAGLALPYAPGALRAAIRTPPLDLLRATRIGSLAGGIPTLGHIALNAPIQAGLKLLSDVPTSVMTGHPEAIPAELYGAIQGIRSWAMHAGMTIRQPGPLATQLGGGTDAQALELGLTGLVRAHPVLQDLANQLAQHMELWRTAANAATDAGYTRLSPRWQAEVQRLVSAPTPQMQTAMARAGELAALRGPMGTTGAAISHALTSAPVLRLAEPIFNIGYQVATQGIERSPMGVLGTGWDVARGLAGAGPYGGVTGFAGTGARGAVTPLAQRIRNNVIGLGLALAGYLAASQKDPNGLPLITGEGPADPQAQQDLRDLGWQGDSTLIGGRYVNNHLFGPAGWGLTAGANAYEAHNALDKQGNPLNLQGVLTDLAGREGRYFTNETFLRGVGSVLNFAGSSAQQSSTAGREAASFLESLIPQGALAANLAAVQDPYARQTQPGDILQAIQSRIPPNPLVPSREQLPARLTGTGQPVANPQQGWGILAPRSTPLNLDPVLLAYARAGNTVSGPPKTLSLGRGREIQMTPEEQRTYQVAKGQMLSELAGTMVNDPKFQNLPISVRNQHLQAVEQRADQYAQKMTLASIPSGDITSRLQYSRGALAPAREGFLPPIDVAEPATP